MTLAALMLMAFTSLGAATVCGALGYGYSSMSVPVALFVMTARVLSPALVLIEVVINLYALFLNRRAAPRVFPRVIPLTIGLVPGVLVGAVLLDYVESAHVKLGTFIVLLPLILLQAAGVRWPIKRERTAAVPLGAGVGVLYGLTTISGPPLALFWNNQGLSKDDFKVGLAIVRTVESVFALLAYAYLGTISAESIGLLPWLVPGVLVGMPLGHWMIRRINTETFRRVCMSFDAYLVALGLSSAVAAAHLAPTAVAYQLLAITAVIDTILLVAFFRRRPPEPAPGAPGGFGLIAEPHS